jgi:hypothetical protein
VDRAFLEKSPAVDDNSVHALKPGLEIVANLIYPPDALSRTVLSSRPAMTVPPSLRLRSQIG